MATDLIESLAPPEPKPITRLDFSCNGVEMTPQEFDAIDEWDENFRYELVRGVVIASPIPAEDEVDPNEELGHLLRDYRQQHPQGKALDKTLPERYVYLRDGSRRRADRVLWTGLGRRPRPKDDVPSVVVEFVSMRKRDHFRDYVTKRREYLPLGVTEYWVINRFIGEMTVFRPEGDIVIKADQVYRTSLLPGFELPLARLLDIAAEWNDQ